MRSRHERQTGSRGDYRDAAAGLEQGTGIEQVNRAVAQMDQVTQQNAALVEEAAAAAESLRHRSQELEKSCERIQDSVYALTICA